MGIFPHNNPRHVEELLQALHFSGEELVTNKEGETFSLREGLLKRFHIKDPSKQFLEAMAQRSASAGELQELMQPDRKAELDRYLWGMEIIDFISDHPSVRFTVEEFLRSLRKVHPRLYSITPTLTDC